MTRIVTVPLDELVELFRFLEELNEIHHAHESAIRPEKLIAYWRDRGNPKLEKFYYDIVWGWLPEDVQHSIEENA